METLYQNKEVQRNGTAMIESPRKVPHNANAKPDSPESFHFWLTITILAIFIMLLYYSQKLQGLM